MPKSRTSAPRSTAARTQAAAGTKAPTSAKQAAAAIKKAEKTDAGADQVQNTYDQHVKQGFVGQEVDPTPNENYSVAGVTSGKPTPESDEKAAAKAREAAGLRR